MWCKNITSAVRAKILLGICFGDLTDKICQYICYWMYTLFAKWFDLIGALYGLQLVLRALWNFVAHGADQTDVAAPRCSEAAASDLGRISSALRWHAWLGISCSTSWPPGWGWAGAAEAGGLGTVCQFPLSVSRWILQFSRLVFQALLNQLMLLLSVFFVQPTNFLWSPYQMM